MTPAPQPWYAHEFPDRPLTQGAFLCCCLLCAVSLERAGMEDAHRPIVFHTGWGTRVWQAQSVSWHRAEEDFHDMLRIFDRNQGNWVRAITVGPRRGRAARGYEPEGPYPRPLADWPVCRHCGPLSTATFATITEFGAKPRRPSAKARAAAEASRLARASLEERVETVAAIHRQVDVELRRSEWQESRPLVVPDHLPEEW
jgi:hypothetical protein